MQGKWISLRGKSARLLSYYSSLEHSEYYIVNAGGDIDEDEHDSKIACTELTVIKRLTKEELFLHGLAYMVDHPRRVWSSHVAANRAMANCGYAVVRGKDPVATGRLGDILLLRRKRRIRKVSYRLL